MSLLLKGIDLPKDGETCYLAISKNASRYVLYEAIDGDFEKLIEARGIEAIQIERPHGRFIDEKEVSKIVNERTLGWGWEYASGYTVLKAIDDAPTILEDEE